MTFITCVAVAVVLAVLRMAGFASAFFQAIAHVFVGGLFAAWIADRQNRKYLALGIALTVVEVGCFLILGRSH